MSTKTLVAWTKIIIAVVKKHPQLKRSICLWTGHLWNINETFMVYSNNVILLSKNVKGELPIHIPFIWHFRKSKTNL